MTEENKKKLEELRATLGDFPSIEEKSAELLGKLVETRKPKMILELGTGRGYSGSLMLFSYDEACLVTIEKDKENYNEAMKHFMENEFYSRVLPVNADATEVVSKMANASDVQKFDLIFLDCAKSSYVRMIDEIISLLSPGGVLVADDCLYFGKVLDGPELPEKKHRTIVMNLRRFLDAVEKDDRLENRNMYKFGNGVLVATRKEY